jgi:hypothetical protein
MAYTNLNNEIFADAALNGFVAELLPFSAFSTNFAPTPVEKGDLVLVPLIASLTATTFSAYNITGGEMSVVTVTINRHKHIAVGQSDLQAANSSEASLVKFAYQQGAALAVAVLSDVFTLLTTGNFGIWQAAISSTAMDVSVLRSARLIMNKANVPKTNRSMMLDCTPFDALLGVTNFVQAHMMGDSLAIKEGRIPRALGFALNELNSGFPGGSVMGFAAHASAIAIAMRYLQPQDGNTYLDARPVAHPETGLVMGLRQHFDNNTGYQYLNLEANYGYSTGITTAGRIIRQLD